MKITNPFPPAQAGPVPSHDRLEEKAGAREAARAGTEQATSATHLSYSGMSTDQDIDTVRVNEIQQAISEGRFEISAGRIADDVIANALELQNGID